MLKKQGKTRLKTKESAVVEELRPIEESTNVDETIFNNNDVKASLNHERRNSLSGHKIMNSEDFEYIDMKYGSSKHFTEINDYIWNSSFMMIMTMQQNVLEVDSQIKKYEQLQRCKDNFENIANECEELNKKMQSNITKMKMSLLEIDKIKSEFTVQDFKNLREEIYSKFQDIHNLMNIKYNEIYKKELLNENVIESK